MMPSAPIVAALVIGLAAVVCDLRTRRIPNVLTLGAAGAGLLFALAVNGLGGLGWSLAGWAVGCAIFLPVFLLGGLGAGDVKLMAALGAWLGPLTVLWIAAYGAIAGGVLALVVSASRGYLGQLFRNLGQMLSYWRVVGPRPVPNLTLADSKSPRLPYAVPIALGMLVALWLR
jgi:prepilin peptidase CpaA